MRFKASLVFGAAVLLATLLLLYQLVSLPPDTLVNQPQQSFEALESRLQKLSNDINQNQDTIKEIRILLEKINNQGGANVISDDHLHEAVLKPPKESIPVVQPPPQSILFNTSLAKINSDDCTFAQSSIPKVDVNMEEVYKELAFDNPNGGVWKQGFDITYNTNQWSPDKPLKVFVMPHSHCDPGWLKVFERYYSDQVAHILDNMVTKLEVDARRRFIYAEISFFSMWWEKQGPGIRERVKKLIAKGQLELVTGGWVMPDEALTHYWSIIDQMVTGHEWLRTNLNYRANNGWAIDPFGLSPTMAYVLKRSGLENMLIQRGHYAIKKYLSENRNLEFRWRQSWDPDSSTEILAHLMPFYSYDVPHTCGPDPSVCCQFDFRRLPGSRMSCPWRHAPQVIGRENVKSRSELLLDQYRKKSQLYRTNTLLIPLGDDFRYDTAEEWDAQFNNYQKIFDYLNNNPSYNAQLKFGTLADYFHALREESRAMQPGGGGGGNEDEEGIFPSLSGDFFTYADKDDNYWSGYFTSRPYYKARSRQLASKIRAAEILLNYAAATMDPQGARVPQAAVDILHRKLEVAHQALGLFQHHDGITGTAKTHVVADYATKLLNGINMAEHVTQFSAHSLLSPSDTDNQFAETVFLESSEEHEGISIISTPRLLRLGSAGRGAVIVFNSHPHEYKGLVTIRVDTVNIRVVNELGKSVMCQVDPVFEGSKPGDVYDVHFSVSLLPLSLSRFVITRQKVADRNYVHFATVSVKSQEMPRLPEEFLVNSEPFDTETRMSAGPLSAEVGSDGLVKTVTQDGLTTQLSVQFVSYGARHGSDMSGAYLFIPSGSATVIKTSSPPTKVVQGPLRSTLTTIMPLLTHIFTLTNSPGIETIAIHNFVNVKSEKNFELAMRIVTDIDNKDTFYTDLNGFQTVRRVRYDKLTLQGNYYPVASQIFIEDSRRRLTLLTSQPQGGSSLSSGELEVMQDRKLMQDDNRGIGQSITDNVVTLNSFRLVLEHRAHVVESNSKANVFPSLLAERVLRDALYPPVVLHQAVKSTTTRSHWTGSLASAPCDIDLVSFRSLQGQGLAVSGSSASLTLRRVAFDCSYPPPRMNCVTDGGKIQLSDILGAAFAEEVRQSTLTHMYAGVNITKSFTLTLQPMELYSFLLNQTPQPH